MNIQIQTIVSMPFAENTYVLWNQGSSDCLIVDPGMEPESILEFLEERQLTAVAILNTHGHADHIAGNASMKEAFPNAPLIIGINDSPLLSNPVLNVSRSYGFDILSPPADTLVKEGDILSFAEIPLSILDIPGHSPGHIVYYCKEAGIVLGGDVLFRQGIGRTDFPGGSFELLASGIRDKLYTLPSETVVYPGHGPVTQIGFERNSNPFVSQ